MRRAIGLLLVLAACGDNVTLQPDAGSPDAAPPDAVHDTTAPDTAITQSPLIVAASAMASFAFTGSDSDDHFECALDTAPFTACASPITLTISDGSHTFAVRAIDTAGNTDASPASFTWMVDTQSPDTTIAQA